jgi:hypothetical protein
MPADTQKSSNTTSQPKEQEPNVMPNKPNFPEPSSPLLPKTISLHCNKDSPSKTSIGQEQVGFLELSNSE